MTAEQRARIHASVDDLLHTRQWPARRRRAAARGRAIVYRMADRHDVADGVYGAVVRVEANLTPAR